MLCMGGFYPRGAMDFELWFLLTLLLLLLLLIKRSKTVQKTYEGMHESAINNQKEMISLLKEIRDSLRK